MVGLLLLLLLVGGGAYAAYKGLLGAAAQTAVVNLVAYIKSKL